MVLDSYLTRSCPNAQYLVMMSMRVRGMVNVQSRRSERARMAMKIFLVVRRTWKINSVGKILGYLEIGFWIFVTVCLPYLICGQSNANAHIAEEAKDYYQTVDNYQYGGWCGVQSIIHYKHMT